MKNEVYAVSIPMEIKKEFRAYCKKMQDEKNVLPRETQTEVVKAGLAALKGGKKK